MSLIGFLSAVLALLLAPGPTNTLMAVAGAQQGFVRVVRLLPAELAGYLTAIVPLAYLGAGLLERVPVAAAIVQGAAAIWVMILAVRLWRLRQGTHQSTHVTEGQVFLTTLLNPKALVLGLVLLPSPGAADFWPRLGVFCLLVTGVAMIWGAAGAVTGAGRGGPARVQILHRIASVWLGAVSVSLALAVVHA